jgi:L-seryl-tRNA(Ser) seleniumtransferase
VASALLQQLDVDYRFEDWTPPAPLIDKRELRGVPRHGIGRACKVGKEQIVGLLAALEIFIREDDATRNRRFAAVSRALLEALRPLTALRVRLVEDHAHGGLPLVEVHVPREGHSIDATGLAARLRAAQPSVHVDSTDADLDRLVLVPTCVAMEDVALVGAAFEAALRA